MIILAFWNFSNFDSIFCGCRNRRRRRRCFWWRTCSLSWRFRVERRARTCMRTSYRYSPSSVPRPTSSSSAGTSPYDPFTPSQSESQKRFAAKYTTNVMQFWLVIFKVKSRSLSHSVNLPLWSGSFSFPSFYSPSFHPDANEKRWDLKKTICLMKKKQEKSRLWQRNDKWNDGGK